MLNLKLAEALRAGKTSIGPFVKGSDPAFVEAAALAGFGHVVIDLEHGPLDVKTAEHLIRAATLHGCAPLVRVARNDSADILRVLDVGAAGVHVPHVNAPEQAQDAVMACKFHPVGQRGVCRYVRAAEYSNMAKAEHFRHSNDQVMCVAHVEGRQGLDNIDGIVGAGVDVVFLGPYDLSQSFGMPGQVQHPDVVAAMVRAVARARDAGVAVGTFADDVSTARFWMNHGVQYICISVDVGIYLDACRSLLDSLGR